MPAVDDEEPAVGADGDAVVVLNSFGPGFFGSPAVDPSPSKLSLASFSDAVPHGRRDEPSSAATRCPSAVEVFRSAAAEVGPVDRFPS